MPMRVETELFAGITARGSCRKGRSEVNREPRRRLRAPRADSSFEIHRLGPVCFSNRRLGMERTCFALHEGKSFGEAAAEFGFSEKQAWKRFHACLRKLRLSLEGKK
jgi:hypothetical protein